MELKTNIRSKSIFGTFCKNKTIFIKYYTHNYRSSTDKIIKYNMNIREKILIKFCSEKKLSENWINTYSWYVKQLTKTLIIIFLKILQYFSVQIWKYGKIYDFFPKLSKYMIIIWNMICGKAVIIYHSTL